MCWRECVQRIDLVCLMRAESYLREDISNLSGCITSWWLLTICRNTLTLTNTNGEINLRLVNTPLLITDKHMHSSWRSHTHSVYATLLSFIWHMEGGDGDSLPVCSSPRPTSRQHLLHSWFCSCSSSGSMLSLFMCCPMIEECQR